MTFKRIVALSALLAALAGCSSGARRVECHWKLTPINPPAPAQETPETAQ